MFELPICAFWKNRGIVRNRGIVMKYLAIAIDLLIAAPAFAQQQATSDNGRYAIVPAGVERDKKQDAIYFHAWRLDTRTGFLEICIYSDTPKEELLVTLSCTSGARPEDARPNHR